MATVSYSRVTVKADFQAQSYLGRTAEISDATALDNGGFAVTYGVVDGVSGDRSPMLEIYGADFETVTNPIFLSADGTVGMRTDPSIATLNNGDVAVFWVGKGNYPQDVGTQRGSIYTVAGEAVYSEVNLGQFLSTPRQIAAHEDGFTIASFFSISGKELPRLSKL